MSNSKARLSGAVALALAAAAVLAGCGSSDSGPAADGVASSPASSATASPSPATPVATAYPLTLTVPGQTAPLTVKAEPQRIAVLSPDAATAVDELVGTSRIVAVPDSSQRASTSVRVKDFAGIAHVIPNGTDPDPEQVLSWNPDLVIVTARHTGEKDASSALTAAGVPVLTLTNNWGTPSAVADDITLIGKALNAQAQAARLVSRINDGVAAVKQHLSSVTTHPSVLMLANMGGMQFVIANDAVTSPLIEDAGGVNAAMKAKLTHTMPVSAEQVVAANPDMIMLIDVMGSGESSFDKIMTNPAVKNLPAVRGGKVKLFGASRIFGIGGVELTDGLEDIAGWIHPEVTE